MSQIADMAREIAGLRAHRQKPEIKTGSLSGLVSALNHSVGLKPADVKNVTSFAFMGIDVVESDLLPDDTAVIMSDGKIVNIIKFGHDMRSPDGTVSMIVSRALWDALEKAGHDMRWYAVAQPIPLGEKSK